MPKQFEQPKILNILLNEWKSLVLIVVVVSALRLLAAVVLGHLGVDSFLSNDSPSYLGPARSLLAQSRFNLENDSSIPMFVRTPGYPVFIMAVWSLLGESIVNIIFAQMLLSGLIAAEVFLLGYVVFGRVCAFLAVSLFALEPLQFVSANHIETETLAGFLYMFIALTAFRLRFSRERFVLACCYFGLSICIATFIRPTTYYFPLVLIPLLFICFKRTIPFAKVAIGVLSFVLLAYGPLIAWQVRNYEVVKSFRFAGIEALSMFYYRAGAVLAHQEGVRFREKLIELRKSRPYPTRQPVGPEFDRLYSEGLSILLNDIPAAAVVHLKGAVSLVLGVRNPVIGYFKLPNTAAVIALLQILWLIAIVLAATAFINVVKKGGPQLLVHVLLAVLPLYVILVSCGPEANPRFRTPIMGIFLIYAAQGVLLLREKLLSVIFKSN